MSRILHKIEEKLHIHHKHGDDIPAAQNKPQEIPVIKDESNVDKKEDDVDDHKKRNLVKKVGKIAKKLLHGHNKNSREEGYEGEEEEEAEEGEEVEMEEAEEGGFEFELDFDF
ncbi:hypothetical protein KY290_014076 [Solanum tuberosum]|uniref:Uncharacterized protein n=1 Tax=Solanum tuberosum TaxID=4113 RepID=A0ABQ7VNM4_SOLTU|nr:hypothetical protein KY289_014174 [Solanum tuberosum]KAH0717471.1 hypothetical protein KY285_013502 [Solanum tuberosum]KAH0770095.1 hypothetical protein KY290_014076 [Solanum tuberosum]